VHAEVTYLRAPRVAGAAFNGIGSQVWLSFDQQTCGAGVAECAALLAPLAPLGAAPACAWARRDLLTVRLGAGATLLPGDNLTVWGGESPPPPRTKWTRRVLHPVLMGHAASLSQVLSRRAAAPRARSATCRCPSRALRSSPRPRCACLARARSARATSRGLLPQRSRRAP
jgi:hypothetical protein